MVQAADQAGHVAAEGKGVAIEYPLQADDAHHRKAEDDGGDGVLLSHHSPVEEAHPRNHEQDQGGADENPGIVCGIDGRAVIPPGRAAEQGQQEHREAEQRSDGWHY